MLSPRFGRRVPEGDTHERRVCDHCGFIDYDNPRIVVGSVVTHDGRYLLCRRAISPRKGYWTIPAGFLEKSESPEEGARREALEEANAELTIDGLMAVYTILHISQVQLIHRAILARAEFSAGPESEEVALFSWTEIPWDELAFPSVRWALEHHRRVEDQVLGPPFTRSSEPLTSPR